MNARCLDYPDNVTIGCKLKSLNIRHAYIYEMPGNLMYK